VVGEARTYRIALGKKVTFHAHSFRVCWLGLFGADHACAKKQKLCEGVGVSADACGVHPGVLGDLVKVSKDKTRVTVTTETQMSKR